LIMVDQPKRKVGYGSPPEEHQFKRGQPSANPKGRPRKNKTYQHSVLEYLNRKLTITTGGRRRKVPVIGVALQQLGNMAAAGNLAAIKEINKLYQQIAPLRPQPEMSPEELKLRQEAANELRGLLIEALDRKASQKKDESARVRPQAPGGSGQTGGSD
jgi:hypothetical protein